MKEREKKHSEDGQIMKQAVQRGYGISVTGDLQSLARHGLL